MSERTRIYARSAADERARLSAAFDALEREVDELVDWRGFVRREPFVPIGIATAAGVACGMLTAPRRVSRDRIPRRLNRARPDGLQNRSTSLISTLWSHTGPALLEMLAARAVGMLLSRLRR